MMVPSTNTYHCLQICLILDLFSYMLVSVVKSFSLYFPHVQSVVLALLIFVTSIPFPLWVTEWTSPSCLACAAAVVCLFAPDFLKCYFAGGGNAISVTGIQQDFWKKPDGVDITKSIQIIKNCLTNKIYRTNFNGMLSKDASSEFA